MYTLKSVRLLAVLALTISLVVFTSVKGEAQSSAIGVIDMKKAVDDSKQGKAASKTLQSKYESLKKNLDAKQKELEKKDADLKKQASTLSQEALEKRSSELAQDVASFRDQAQRSTEEMQKALADGMQPLIAKAEKAAASIAQARGYTLIVDVKEGGVVYFQNAIDITEDVTKSIDGGK